MSSSRASRSTSGGVFNLLVEVSHLGLRQATYLGIERVTHLGNFTVLLVGPSHKEELGLRAGMMMVTRPWRVSSVPGP